MTRDKLVRALVVCGLCVGCGTTTTSPPRQALTTGAGAPTSVAVTQSIDATGGMLKSQDGRLTLLVAPNTVTQATSFSIQPITSLAPNTLGGGYRLEPHDITFAQPVTVTLHAAEAGVSRTSVEGLAPASRDAEGHWVWGTNVTRDADAKTIAFTTTHFSDWSLLEGLQLRPQVATVKEGSSLDLQAIYCTETKEGDLVGLVHLCGRDEGSTWAAVDWAVNGTPGGNATVGTIQASVTDPSKGQYVAPSTRPTPSTVTVSAKLVGSSARPKMTVVAELSVGTPSSMHGPLTVSSTGGLIAYSATGDAVLTPIDDSATSTTYELVGSLTLPTTPLMLATAECNAAERTKPFKVVVTLDKTPLALSLALDAVWPVSCVSNGQPFSSAVALQWLTGCSPSTRVGVPVADPNHFEGQFTRSQDDCSAGQVVGSTTVSWNLVQFGR